MEGSSNTTSFASILAGVQKLRDSANKETPDKEKNASDDNGANQSKETNTDRNTNTNEVQETVTSRDARVIRDIRGVRDFKAPPSRTQFSKTSLYQREYARTKSTVDSKIAIHPSQKGNPLIKSLKNVPYEYTSIIKTDYLINSKISVFFLSLKYHKLKPEYIYTRLKNFGTMTEGTDTQLKILLVLQDSETNYWDSLSELTKMCIFNGLSLVSVWSFEEAGDYVSLLNSADSLSMLRSSGGDKFDVIKGAKKSDYYSRLLDTLTSVRSVNKTDVRKIASSGKFGSLRDLIMDETDLEMIQGFGNTKLKRFHETVSDDFLYGKNYDEDEQVQKWKEKCLQLRLAKSESESVSL